MKMKDPGIGGRYHKKAKRVINKDGTFNVLKSGIGPNLYNIYDALINMSWWNFLGLSALAFFIFNCLFALMYLFIGVEHLLGTNPGDGIQNFWQALFFSTQTFTTVGYGAIAPISHTISLIAAIEAMVGLMFFALVTGLLYGRFSRPMSKLQFSSNILVSPYQDTNALQFRVANKRHNVLIEMEAQVMLTLVENQDGQYKRNFYHLKLERDHIHWFPLNWTLVHPITDQSPLHGYNLDTLKKAEAEVLILLKGFDDNYSQMVHTKYSYLDSDFIWGAKFAPAYHIGDQGDIIMDLSKLDLYDAVQLNPL